jgi:hypothetical protein
MKFDEIRVYNSKALYVLQEVQPLEFALLSPLNRLNFLIGFLDENKSEIVESYISELEETYSRKTRESEIELTNIEIKKLISDLPNLKKYPGLARGSLKFFLNLLKFNANVDWIREEVEVPQRNYLRSFLVPQYINVERLATVIERSEAVKLYKRYITEFLIERYKEKDDNVDSLELLWKRYFENYEENETDHWVAIQSKPSNGKLIFRKDVCLWNDALDDLFDLEFKYLVCCYGDFQGAKSENKHFILTMEHTIAKGDPYCSCVFHDTRIDWNLKHPPKEYWDNLWPLQEWQKKE